MSEDNFLQRIEVLYMLEIVFAIGIFSIFIALFFAWHVLKQDRGSPKMQEISAHIREGAEAFIKRQYRTIAMIAVITAAVMFGAYYLLGKIDLAVNVASAFLLGAFLSAIAGIVGMVISVRANVRTAAAAKKSAGDAMRVALLGGAVSGILVVALSLLGVAGIYYAFGANPQTTPFMIVGFAFGASFVALFAHTF